MVHLEPIAEWCGAEYVNKTVVKIDANKNKIHTDDGSIVDYDVAVVNVGSKTQGTFRVKGVNKHALKTRPINDLLPRIEAREMELKTQGVIPKVAVCGAGAAGTELAFAFKKRWDDLFETDIKVDLLAEDQTIMANECLSFQNLALNKLAEKGINVHTGFKVNEVTEEGVVAKDGRALDANVTVWATGAEPQPVSKISNLDTCPQGYILVNNYLQSTSHENVFAGGDCITMKEYMNKGYPTKAGVYAVREGPIIAQNVLKYINGNTSYNEFRPQQTFLALLTCGDKAGIGSKFGIAFSGKWVWAMKDHIDSKFMNILNPNYLFHDYKTKGTAEPVKDNLLFEQETRGEQMKLSNMRINVSYMGVDEAAKKLSCEENVLDFMEKYLILERMSKDKSFAMDVCKEFRPPYL